MSRNLEQLKCSLNVSLHSLLRSKGFEVIPSVYYSNALSCICIDVSIAIVHDKAVNFVTKYCKDRDILITQFSQTKILIQIENAYKLLAMLKLEGY